MFTRWRIGWCMSALYPRAMGVAPGGAQMSVAGEKDAILSSRLLGTWMWILDLVYASLYEL